MAEWHLERPRLVKEDALVVYEERRPPEGMSAKE